MSRDRATCHGAGPWVMGQWHVSWSRPMGHGAERRGVRAGHALPYLELVQLNSSQPSNYLSLILFSSSPGVLGC